MNEIESGISFVKVSGEFVLQLMLIQQEARVLCGFSVFLVVFSDAMRKGFRSLFAFSGIGMLHLSGLQSVTESMNDCDAICSVSVANSCLLSRQARALFYNNDIGRPHMCKMSIFADHQKEYLCSGAAVAAADITITSGTMVSTSL